MGWYSWPSVIGRQDLVIGIGSLGERPRGFIFLPNFSFLSLFPDHCEVSDFPPPYPSLLEPVNYGFKYELK